MKVKGMDFGDDVGIWYECPTCKKWLSPKDKLIHHMRLEFQANSSAQPIHLQPPSVASPTGLDKEVVIKQEMEGAAAANPKRFLHTSKRLSTGTGLGILQAPKTDSSQVLLDGAPTEPLREPLSIINANSSNEVGSVAVQCKGDDISQLKARTPLRRSARIRVKALTLPKRRWTRCSFLEQLHTKQATAQRHRSTTGKREESSSSSSLPVSSETPSQRVSTERNILKASNRPKRKRKQEAVPSQQSAFSGKDLEVLEKERRPWGKQQKRFKCKYCANMFAQRNNLDAHIRTHTGEKPFKCKYRSCKKTFAQLTNLNNHMRTHTGERPFPCSFCPMKFTQMANLDHHERLHTGIKPYQCHICNKSFAQLSTYQLHMKSH